MSVGDSKNRGLVGALGTLDHVAVERGLAEFRCGRPVLITGTGETALALPVGAAIGYLFGLLIMSGFNNEIYRLSFKVSAATVAWSFLTIIAAAVLSGLVVRRRLDRLDLVAVLKTRE